MNCLFIYNPESGNGRITKKVAYIVQELKKKYEQVDVYPTKAPKDMLNYVDKVCENYSALVFAGGDGSFNEVLQGICRHEKKPVFAYIPCGTVNDIARATKIPRTIKGAVKNILNGVDSPFDVMKINDCYAMYCVCCGAFTSASYLAPRDLKKAYGRLAYGLHAIKNNINFQTFNMKIETEKEKFSTDTVFVLAMNGRSVAGFFVNADGKMDDGEVEFICVKQVPNPKAINRIHAFFRVIKFFVVGYKHIRENDIERLKGSHFKLYTSENVYWNFDGEQGINGNITLDVLPKHIKLIVPKSK